MNNIKANFIEQNNQITNRNQSNAMLSTRDEGCDYDWEIAKPIEESAQTMKISASVYDEDISSSHEEAKPNLGEIISENNLIISLDEKSTILRDHVTFENLGGALEITDRVLMSSVIIGSPDDYHNWAVDLARLKLTEAACRILERGISEYPSAVELLADYLFYGREIGSPAVRDNTIKYYKVLQMIPHDYWTWRAYSFSLEFLLDWRDRRDYTKPDMFEGEVERLIKAYYSNIKDDERPYLMEARINSRVNQPKTEEILKLAHENLKSCPLCSLRYAELLLNRATNIIDYKEVYEYLEKSLWQVSDFEVDHGYIYFLKGLCLIRFFKEKENNTDVDSQINEIYQCFRIAEDEGMRLLPRHRVVIRKEIRILEILTGIDYE